MRRRRGPSPPVIREASARRLEQCVQHVADAVGAQPLAVFLRPEREADNVLVGAGPGQRADHAEREASRVAAGGSAAGPGGGLAARRAVSARWRRVGARQRQRGAARSSEQGSGPGAVAASPVAAADAAAAPVACGGGPQWRRVAAGVRGGFAVSAAGGLARRARTSEWHAGGRSVAKPPSGEAGARSGALIADGGPPDPSGGAQDGVKRSGDDPKQSARQTSRPRAGASRAAWRRSTQGPKPTSLRDA